MTESGTIGATFHGTRIDLWPQAADGTPMPDGLTATTGTGLLTGDLLGPRSGQDVGEPIPLGPTADCPGGEFVISPEQGGAGSQTQTFPNGDQMYSQVVTQTSCFDSVGGFTSSATMTILGGTGALVGVTGSQELSTAGFIQAFDAASGDAFFSAVGTFTATLNMPIVDGTDDQDCNGDGVVNGADLIGAGCEDS